MRVKCPHCGYEWDYKGRTGQKKLSTTCPSCRRVVMLREVKG
jgi:DNA-directed RNA polymerase subunit RPC12/RpoP